MTEQELDEIEKRANAAMRGPWEIREDKDYYEAGTYVGISPYHYVNGRVVDGRNPNNPDDCYFGHDVFRLEGTQEDLDFLLRVRSDVPRLCAALRQQLSRDDIYAKAFAEMDQRRRRIDDLEDEVARLRDALDQIASCEKRIDGDVVDIARRALAAGEGGGA